MFSPQLRALRLILCVFCAALSWMETSLAAELPPDRLQATIPAPTTGAQDGAEAGRSVAISGEWAVVGAPYDDTGGRDSGVVKIFHAKTGALARVLKNPAPLEIDRFGYAVAISGSRVAAAAIGQRKVHVFDLSSPDPNLPVVTVPGPGTTNDAFGLVVALDGTLLGVGAPGSNVGAAEAGAAYLYDLATANPTVPIAALHEPQAQSHASFGNSLAISSGRVVIGARGTDRGGIANCGAAYVYEVSGGSIVGPMALNDPTPAVNAAFGQVVAISGTRVAVAAPRATSLPGTPPASVYIFDLARETPAQHVLSLPGEKVSSVALSGGRLVVGKGFVDVPAEDAGECSVYDLDSATPTAARHLANPSPATYDEFGFSVAASGEIVIVGTPQDDTGARNAGSAYVYDFGQGAAPPSPVILNDPGPSGFDTFGAAIAMTSDWLVISAPRQNVVPATAAQVFVYDLKSGIPAQPALVLARPGGEVSGGFGFAVAVHGNRVVVGDYLGAARTGAAYVYDLAGPNPSVPAITIRNPRATEGELFGAAVAIHGNGVVVGARGESSVNNSGGVAYVYDLAQPDPTAPVLTLRDPNPIEFQEEFGRAVAISDSHIAIGSLRGRVLVYERGAASSVPKHVFVRPNIFGGFGSALAIEGATLVVGAREDDAAAENAGSVSVFDLAVSDPEQSVKTLFSPEPVSSDSFGAAVAISGTRVVAGATQDYRRRPNPGVAFVFDLASPFPSETVIPLRNPQASNQDYFGAAVAIAGTTTVIGSPGEDSVVADKGCAYLFAPVTPRPELTQPESGSTFGRAVHIAYKLFDEVVPGSLKLTFAAGEVSVPLTIAPGGENAGAHSFTLDPLAPSTSPHIAAGAAIPDGSYRVTLSYQVPGGYNRASNSAEEVRLDTTGPSITPPAVDPVLVAQNGSIPLPNYAEQAEASDPSGVQSLTQVPAPGTLVSEGTIEVTLRATDNLGNESTLVLSVPVRVAGTALLASTGGLVPNPTGDPRIPEGSVWKTFGIPSIAMSGQRAGWIGTARAPSGSTFRGIFQGELGAPRLLLRIGDPVPDASGSPRRGVVFAAFREPVFAGDHCAVTATVRGPGITEANNTGIWFCNAEGAREVAREGTIAAGTGKARFEQFTSVVMTSGGTVFFTAMVDGQADRKDGLWTWSSEQGARLALRPGSRQDPTDLIPIRSFRALQLIPGSPGHGRYQDLENEAWALTHLADGTTFQVQINATDNITRGGPGEWGPGFILQRLGIPSPEETGLYWAFRGAVAPSAALGIPPGKNAGILTENLWAPRGSTAPGAEPARFAAWMDPVMGRVPAGRSTAFIASLAGAPVSADRGIWQVRDGLELLAREGDPAVGTQGARWKEFNSLSVQDLRGPLFTARLARGAKGAAASRDVGLWGTRTDGTMVLLLRAGMEIGGKVVSHFNALGGVAGSPGQRRAWSAGDPSGRILCRVFFTDRSSAILCLAVP